MKLALVALAAWLFGVLSALGYVAVSGYEYLHNGDVSDQANFSGVVNEGGWEPVMVGSELFLRRPRVRIGR